MRYLVAIFLFTASLHAQPLDDVRARMWLTNTLNAQHRGHAPKFTVRDRDAGYVNIMAEVETRLQDIKPGIPVSVWTMIDRRDKSICRVKNCPEARERAGKVSVKTQWEAAPGATGYWFLQGTNSGRYVSSNYVGNVTNVFVSLLDTNAVNYFALIAEFPTGRSGLSTEFSYDPNGNEYLLIFRTHVYQKQFTNSDLGILNYVPPAGQQLLPALFGWWTAGQRLEIPDAATLRTLYP